MPNEGSPSNLSSRSPILQPITRSSRSRSRVLRAGRTLREHELLVVCIAWTHEITRRFTVERPPRNQVVCYGIDTTLNVTCTQSNRGRFEARVQVLFEDVLSGERFVIVRPVLATIGNVEEHGALQPTAPYVPPRRPRQQRRVTEVEEGVVSRFPPKRIMMRFTIFFVHRQAPPFETSVPWRSRLPFYTIPEELFTFLSRQQQNLVLETGRRFLPQQLVPETYIRMFEVLLWCEEYKISYVI